MEIYLAWRRLATAGLLLLPLLNGCGGKDINDQPDDSTPNEASLELTVDYPPNASITRGGLKEITVRGTVNESSLTSDTQIFVNDTPAELNTDGNWHSTIELTSGLNTVNITAQNNSQNSTQAITLDNRWHFTSFLEAQGATRNLYGVHGKRNLIKYNLDTGITEPLFTANAWVIENDCDNIINGIVYPELEKAVVICQSEVFGANERIFIISLADQGVLFTRDERLSSYWQLSALPDSKVITSLDDFQLLLLDIQSLDSAIVSIDTVLNDLEDEIILSTNSEFINLAPPRVNARNIQVTTQNLLDIDLSAITETTTVGGWIDAPFVKENYYSSGNGEEGSITINSDSSIIIREGESTLEVSGYLSEQDADKFFRAPSKYLAKADNYWYVRSHENDVLRIDSQTKKQQKVLTSPIQGKELELISFTGNSALRATVDLENLSTLELNSAELTPINLNIERIPESLGGPSFFSDVAITPDKTIIVAARHFNANRYASRTFNMLDIYHSDDGNLHKSITASTLIQQAEFTSSGGGLYEINNLQLSDNGESLIFSMHFSASGTGSDSRAGIFRLNLANDQLEMLAEWQSARPLYFSPIDMGPIANEMIPFKNSITNSITLLDLATNTTTPIQSNHEQYTAMSNPHLAENGKYIYQYVSDNNSSSYMPTMLLIRINTMTGGTEVISSDLQGYEQIFHGGRLHINHEKNLAYVLGAWSYIIINLLSGQQLAMNYPSN